MWRVESELDAQGAPYERRAAVFDRLVRSRPYNRIAWSCAPQDYAAFAAVAFASANGPLLEVAAGTAAATAQLHATSQRTTVLLDLSSAMLERAARRIAGHTGAGRDEIPPRIRLVQADLLQPPFPPHGFSTILGLGLTHLFDDPGPLVAALRAQLIPGGLIFLAGLVSQTRRGRAYLEVLHRLGEVALPRTAEELRTALGHPTHFRTDGCMAYATLAAA